MRLMVLSLSVPAFFFSITTPVAASSTLIIGEVNWAGSSLSTADEWIELWNLDETSVDLSGFALLGAGGGVPGIIFASSTVIAAKSTFLVSNYSAADIKSSLAVEPDVVTSSLSLPNEHLQITLSDMNGNPVDQAGDGTAPFAGASLPTKISMIRTTPTAAGTQSASWENASSSVGFDPGTDANGTPGACDACAEIPIIDAPYVEPQVASTTTESIVSEPTTESTSTEPILVPIEEPVIVPLDEPMSATGTEPTTTSTETIIVIPYPAEPLAVAEEIVPTTTSTVPEPTPAPIVTETPAVETTIATEVVTTTETIVIEEATSTEAMLLPTASNATTTTEETIEPTETIGSAPTTTETLSPLVVHIHRILPNPSSGPEWVELDGLANDETNRLLDWTLEDAVGTIFRFTSTTLPFLQHEDDILRVSLSGSHLNNSGDTVRVRDAQGTLVNEMTFGNLEKDETWPLPPVVTTPLPVVTPAPTVTIPPPLAPVAVVTIPAPVTTTLSVTLPQAAHVTTTAQKTIASTKTTKPKVVTITVPKTKSTSSVAAKTTATKQKQVKQPTKKPAAAKTKNATASSSTAPRLTLTGIVGSVPGLLAQNRFVIQTDDGRGLLVKGNGKQPSPAFGSLVRITGMLITNDQGTTLQMSAKDAWSLLKTDQRVEPRAVDFFSPSKEDAWSLIHVTGTVLESKNGLVHIDTDDATLSIKVRPVVKYRAERLKAGDVVSITGLFEPKDEESLVYPRRAEEIELLARAPTKNDASSQTTSGMPPWSPFGAAGITVALTQGYKRFQKIREQRRLETALAKASREIRSLTS